MVCYGCEREGALASWGRFVLFRNIIVGLLIASCSLGSFPAGVGAYQAAGMRDNIPTALAGYARAQSDMAARMERSNAEINDGGYAQNDSGSSCDEGVAEVELENTSSSGEAQPDAQALRASTDDAKDQAAPANAEQTGSTEPAGRENADADAISSAEQDAARIDGAEVLQQGDGQTTGNVLVADRAAVDALGGRDFVGQAVKEINGTKYILIGNEQQLRAIGSGKKVISGQVWSIEQEKDGILDAWHDVAGTKPALFYEGDADLAKSSILHDGKIEDHESTGHHKRLKYFTYNADGTRNDDVGVLSTGLTYSIDANYLIFRNIDLRTNAADPGNTGWEPLMFSSTMLGAKSARSNAAGSLWDCIKQDGSGITDVTKVANPVISNVNVVQSGSLSVAKQQGIGFFGTITSDHHDDDVFFGSSAGESEQYHA